MARPRCFWIVSQLYLSIGAESGSMLRSHEGTLGSIILPRARNITDSFRLVRQFLRSSNLVAGIGFGDFVEVRVIGSRTWHTLFFAEFGPRHY